MCKSSSHALPTTTAPSSSHRRRSPSTGTGTASSSSAATATTSSGPRTTTTTTTGTGTASSSSHSSRSSLAAEGARASLPYQPVLYSFHELAAATNNFLAKRNPSDATFWRCSLRSRHAALFQLRPLPQLTPAAASAALARVARYHHASLARLLGACPAGAHVYLAYELPTSACTLAACLSSSSSSSRAGGGTSSTNTNTVLPTWLSRVQVAVDVAQGIEYAHAHADAAHGRVSPSSVLLVPDAGSSKGVRGVLTHFGAAHFADAQATEQPPSKAKGGKAGDVRAFGVLLLGLLAGEPAESRYRFDRGTKELARVSVVDTAAEAVRTGRVRSWLDRRLGDSFPVAAAERLVEVGLRCAAGDDEEEERPEMAWVAGKVSRVYVESRAWERTLQPHSDDLSSVALAPR
ncbi:hypothetical protein ZWY2020_054275 [Hordeum vulgare]|nr:hypothetical protein ZWY2020_054275 [Hordeum vulgare]